MLAQICKSTETSREPEHHVVAFVYVMNRFICLCTTRKFVMRLGDPCRLTVKGLGWDRRIGQCYDSPRFPSTYKSKKRLISYLSTYVSVISSYIMIFQVSTGKSASLNDQSNFSSATGSSVGSWYGARYSWASASPALIRFLGSKTSIRSSKSIAMISSALNLV